MCVNRSNHRGEGDKREEDCISYFTIKVHKFNKGTLWFKARQKLSSRGSVNTDAPALSSPWRVEVVDFLSSSRRTSSWFSAPRPISSCDSSASASIFFESFPAWRVEIVDFLSSSRRTSSYVSAPIYSCYSSASLSFAFFSDRIQRVHQAARISSILNVRRKRRGIVEEAHSTERIAHCWTCGNVSRIVRVFVVGHDGRGRCCIDSRECTDAFSEPTAYRGTPCREFVEWVSDVA